MRKHLLYTLAASLLLFTGIAFTGCKKETVEDTDVLLLEALNDASGNQGTAYFTLPESNDYSNIPQDPKNPITREKVELGRYLYHETALSINPKDISSTGTYSCASCHHAQGGFQACLQQGIAEGGIGFGTTGEGRFPNPSLSTDSIDVQPIRTPSVLNAAYQQVQLWNGQFGATGMNTGTEGQWTAGTPKEANSLGYEGVETQAIAGLKVHRMGVDTTFILSTDYKALFDIAFPDVPESDRYTREMAGLAIAAFERTVLSNQSPFQLWLKGNHSAMTEDQKQGAILFFGKAECYKCHTGPALNSMAFYALGMNDLELPGVYGTGVDMPTRKGRGGFTGNSADDYKFKVPQLYSLKKSPFYGHGSSFSSVEAVVKYKNDAIAENSVVPAGQLASEFHSLNLSEKEINKIVDFIENGLLDEDLERYVPSSLPSGNCFPNNDVISKIDLGCD